MLKLSPKQQANRAKFINQVRIGDPNVPDYQTGRESKFHMASGSSSRDPDAQPDLRFYPGCPEFSTPHWIRTIRD